MRRMRSWKRGLMRKKSKSGSDFKPRESGRTLPVSFLEPGNHLLGFPQAGIRDSHGHWRDYSRFEASRRLSIQSCIERWYPAASRTAV